MKLKGTKKGKSFKKGDQCVQNPETRKHRDNVKKNVFTQRKSGGGLTIEALEKHDEAVDDEISMGGLTLSDTSGVSTKSKAFSISGLTDCSNISFHHVMKSWSSTNSMDQEKCAILAAVTEVIRSKGGTETESEYFAALMTALEASTEESSTTAISFLLGLVIKKIPSAILKKKFPEASKCFVTLLERYYDTGKTSMIISLLQCVGAVLMPQEAAVWGEASTQHTFQILLTYTIHGKPKVRRLAQSLAQSLLKVNLWSHKKHPVGMAATKFCVQMVEQHSDDKSPRPHYVLNLLKESLQYFNADNLKEICESILRLLTLNNHVLRKNTMDTLQAMFKAHPPAENLPIDINMKLIAVLYDFQSNISDNTLASSWLNLMLAAHSNLALIADATCLRILPKFYGICMKFFLSENKGVVKAAADVMKQTSEQCIEPAMLLVEEDIKSSNSAFIKIFKHIEAGLGYKYAPVWDIVLRSLQYMYLAFGKNCASVFRENIGSLIDMYQSPDFPFKSSLEKAVGAGFKSLGPEFVLKERPLNIIQDNDVCQFPTAWLLPVMKVNIENTSLQFFISHFLPMAAQVRQKALKHREEKEDLEAKVFETLLLQIWGLLPGFCTTPTDLSDSFKNIAKILGIALSDRADLRPVILQALRALVNRTTDEDDLKCVGQFAKNYVPILFNLYTSDNEDCKGLSLSILETIKSFLVVTDLQLISIFITKILEKLKKETVAEKRHHQMDLAVCMVRYSEGSLLQDFYEVAVNSVKDKDKSVQKKGYRMLEEILASNSKSCNDLLTEKFDEFKSMVADSVSNAAPSSKAPRLRCLSAIVKRLDAEHKEFLQIIIPEVILCTKAVSVKARDAAYDLISDIGSAYANLSNLPREECIANYFQFVMAGLAASPHMVSATLLTFTKLIHTYRHCISAQLIGTVLESAIDLLKSKTQEVVKSSMFFIRAVTKILDANELSVHLESMIKNLFSWNSTSGRCTYKVQMQYILEKLIIKCGYELTRSFVPEEHRKFIVHIHKLRERKKRQRKEGKENQGTEQEEADVVKNKDSWEDILQDSDDEKEEGSRNERNNQGKKQEKGKTWIVEGDDGMDLLDPSAAKQIVGTKPKKAKLKSNDDFGVSSDGRMMINGSDDEDDEIDDDAPLDIGEGDMLSGFDKVPKKLKLGKRKQLEEMPEDDDEMQYQPGGKGIHRRQEDGPPVKQKRFGEEYKAKKSDGDTKLKGKPDPYAYIPLNRQKLNKRKQAKLSGQFDGMVKAARKGAHSGGKHRKMKNDKGER